jgi:hypothetical protein
LGRADGDGDDLGDNALFLQTGRLFNGDFVEGVHGHLDVGDVDTRAVGLHANFHVVVDNPLDRNESLHALFSCVMRMS